MAELALAAAIATGPHAVAWAPQPGSQTLFLACPIAECLYEGTRGAAKTDALLMDFAKDVGQGHGAAWRGILFRQTYKQLDDVVARSKRWFHRIFPKAEWLASKDSYLWRFPDGEELLFRHMLTPDDYWDYHGHEYPWQGWEELTNWPDLECYQAMAACWRSSVAGIPKRRRSTANPFGNGHHAVKAYWVDPAPAGHVITDEQGNRRVRIHGHWSENRIMLAADPDYPKRLAADTNANRKKAWLYGDWDIVAGGFFDDLWDRDKHAIPAFEIPSSWTIDRSFDWGSSRPFSVGWWAESDGTTAPNGITYPRGTLFRIAEWYGWTGKPNEGLRMLARDIATGLLEREEELGIAGRVIDGPADSSIFDVENGNSIAVDMEDAGVTWERADKSPGSRKTGWQKVRARLAAAIATPLEEPGLYVFRERCTDGFIRTLPVLPRHPRKIDDIDDAAEDHAADDTRYRLLASRAIWQTTEVVY